MRRPGLILATTAALCLSAPMLGSAGAQSPNGGQVPAVTGTAGATGTTGDARLRGAVGPATRQPASSASRNAASAGTKDVASRNIAAGKPAAPDARGRSAVPQARTVGNVPASGEEDPNLPGVRLRPRGTAASPPVPGSGAQAAPSAFALPAPRTLGSGASGRDDQDQDVKARRLSGGGVMTGDVSIGGTLGAGPLNSNSGAGRW